MFVIWVELLLNHLIYHNRNGEIESGEWLENNTGISPGFYTPYVDLEKFS